MSLHLTPKENATYTKWRNFIHYALDLSRENYHQYRKELQKRNAHQEYLKIKTLGYHNWLLKHAYFAYPCSYINEVSSPFIQEAIQ